MTIQEELTALLANYEALRPISAKIYGAYELMETGFSEGGKLLLCGNGGSAADSEHIAGELLKGFKRRRLITRELDFQSAGAEDVNQFYDKLQGGLPAISLVGHCAFFTAWCNDVDAAFVMAQQVYALGKRGDMLFVMSTSGNSRNIVNAVITARAKGLKTIAMTGQTDSRLSALCDCCIQVPATETFRVQEYHLPIYHALCAMLETRFFAKEDAECVNI